MVTFMKSGRILAAVLVLCLLLPGCAAQKTPVKDTFTTTTTAEPTEATENKWEQILTYAEYLEMNAQERSDFADSFEDSADFFQWLQAVKAIYEQNRKENEIGQDGNIDMDQINPNG